MIQDLKKEFMVSSQTNTVRIFKQMYSHNMRSIFSKILMSADLGSLYLDDPENRSNLREMLEIIREQVNKGYQIISNLDKLSFLDNKLLEIKPVKVYDNLSEVINYIKKSNKISNISMKVESLNRDIIVKANDLLKDIFENIIINAINYNNNPIIEIFIIITEQFDKKRGKLVRIEFIDNGIGVPDSKKENIFTKNTHGKGGKGMGLGLSLVKQIVEIFKGNIWVEDRIKGDHRQGSNFILLLPKLQN
ncbi:MAG: ATP-binding protein [Promethearchaeota archaeon]